MSPMMRGAFLKARKYAVAASAALRERTTYGGSFLGSTLAYGLFVFVFSRVWSAALEGRADIAGYGLKQLIWYFAVAEIPSFAFGGAFWTLAQDVKSGQIAYLVSRPYGFVAFSYAQGMGRALANFAVLFAEGLAIGFLTAGAPPLSSPGQALCALCAIVIGGSVYYLLQLSIALTALWVEENSAFFWIFQKLILIAGTLMPLEFLPEAAQRVAWWTPLPAMSYAPARLFAVWQGGIEAPRLLGFQLAWVGISALVCHAVYSLGRARLTVNGG